VYIRVSSIYPMYFTAIFAIGKSCCHTHGTPNVFRSSIPDYAHVGISEQMYIHYHKIAHK